MDQPVLSITLLRFFYRYVLELDRSRFSLHGITHIVDLQRGEETTIVFDVLSTFQFDIDILNTLEPSISQANDSHLHSRYFRHFSPMKS